MKNMSDNIRTFMLLEQEEPGIPNIVLLKNISGILQKYFVELKKDIAKLEDMSDGNLKKEVTQIFGQVQKSLLDLDKKIKGQAAEATKAVNQDNTTIQTTK